MSVSGAKMKEILTLQFGGYSNAVGSHYWNFQDAQSCKQQQTPKQSKELDSDLLYRSGQTEKGTTTFTPRVVAWDAQGSLGSLRREGYLYQQTNYSDSRSAIDTATWKTSVQVVQEEAYPCSEALMAVRHGESLEKVAESSYPEDHEVQRWTDYLQSHLHPRTIQEVKECKSFDEFHNFCEGKWTGSKMNRDNCEDSWENVRFFLEECDSIQGVQCLVDVDSGWAGYCSDLLQELREECRSASIMTYGMDWKYPLMPAEGEQQKRQGRRLMNLGLSTQALQEASSMYIPVSCSNYAASCFPNLEFEKSSLYHTSSIIATALEVSTSPYRVRGSSCTMAQLASAVSMSASTNIAELSCSFPGTSITMNSGGTGISGSSSFLPQHTSSVVNTPSFFAKWITFRGVKTTTAQSKSLAEALTFGPYDRWRICEIESELEKPKFYPNIMPSRDIETFGASSELSSSSNIALYVDSVVKGVKSVDARVRNEYLRAGMETDDFNTILADLHTIVDAYC